ncbi:MAG: hypothetical protein ACYDCI_00740 [Candidatus Limnocylindrales bacterium]
MPRAVVAWLLSLVLAGCGSTPGPTAAPVSAIPTGPPTANPTATVAVSLPPSSSPSPTTVDVLPGAFTTPIPPPAGSAWTTIRWHRLSATDPLALVQSVVPWRGGFIAVGADRTSATGAWTPLWRSSDGVTWRPLGQVFGARTIVLGVAAIGTGLVALTANGGNPSCPPWVCGSLAATVMAWTSSDGVSWLAHVGPDLALPQDASQPPMVTLASGPGGLVAASVSESGGAGTAAVSLDGVTWVSLPVDALPKNAAIRDVRGGRAGFVAVARTWPAGSSVTGSVALRSTDGRTWTSVPLLPLAAPWVALVDQLLQARDGFLATGSDYGLPGTTLWWWSADGRSWRAVKGYPPIGTCPSAICLGTEPVGDLGADGTRIVAYRGGAAPGVWTSFDGRSWTRLVVTGAALTLVQAGGNLVVLPGGVLVSDGSTTWFGETSAR